jgi:acetyltransferase-like isoleucine patch superfamily enzyme
VICEGVEIGDDCAVGSGVYIGKNCKIGNGVRIQDKAHITDYMVIEDNVFIGPCAVTMNDRYPKVNNPGYQREPPYFEEGCSIGAGAIILPGVRIGKFSMIGAGAVVTKDVMAEEIAVGCPAKKINNYERKSD